MAGEKQQLRFKVGHKAVSYMGYPENRVKDLMQALIRLNTSEEDVVDAFRENIPEESGMSDDLVLQKFEEVRKQHNEKQKHKHASAAATATAGGGSKGNSTSNNTNNNNNASTDDTPQRITVSYKGRVYACNSTPDNKSRAVVELLIKQPAITRQDTISAYRENLPMTTLSDDEIWAQVEEAKAKGNNNSSRNGGNNNNNLSASNGETNRTGASSRNSSPATAALQSGSGPGSAVPVETFDDEERDRLSRFIMDVVNGTGPSSLMHESNESSQLAWDTESESNMTARSIAGKERVDCQEEGTTQYKLILVPHDMTFEDFMNVVEKKFSRRMSVFFHEGTDEVQVDDDDGLEMFLRQPVTDGRRKLICYDPELCPHRARQLSSRSGSVNSSMGKAPKGALSGRKTASQWKVDPFTNGTLEVTPDRTYAGHTLAVLCCAMTPDGDHFCTASRDGTLRVWDSVDGSNVAMAENNEDAYVLSCDITANGKYVVGGYSNNHIKVWNVAKSKKSESMKGHEGQIYCVQFNAEGDHVCSSSADWTVRVWSVHSGKCKGVFEDHGQPVFGCSFSNSDNGRFVVSGGDSRVLKIWEWSTGKEMRTMTGHKGSVWSCRFSADDSRVLSSSKEGEVRLWDATTGAGLITYKTPGHPVHHAIFSDNGKYVLACGRDWAITVWDLDTAVKLEVIVGHRSTVYRMAMAKSKLITCSLDKTVKSWFIQDLK